MKVYQELMESQILSVTEIWHSCTWHGLVFQYDWDCTRESCRGIPEPKGENLTSDLSAYVDILIEQSQGYKTASCLGGC